MKRIFAYAFLLTLIGGTSIWAYNNRKDNDDNVNDSNTWGRRRSDDKDGPLKTTAWIDIDVDYPGERWYVREYGITHEGYAKVKANFGLHNSGYYSISASANNRYPLYDGDEWNMWANEDISDSHFIRCSGGRENDLRDGVDIQSRLDNSGCEATASLDQDAQSGSGSGSGTPVYRSTADVD